MKAAPPNPPRLVDLAHDPDSAQVARIVRAVGPVSPLSRTTAARIQERLGRPASSGWGTRRLVWVTTLVLVLTGAGVATAHYGRTLIARLRQVDAPQPQPSIRPSAKPPQAPAPIIEPAPQEAPPASPPVAARPRSLAARAPHPRSEAAPVPEPSALARESETLGRAVAALRSQHAPMQALRILDDYDREFPAGSMHAEALVLRVDALVAAGDERKALAQLDGLSASKLAPLPRLRLLRGQLRARLGDCEKALADYDALLASATANELRGDALFARGSCRARIGRTAEAQQDYRQYLDAYPTGRHASKAREALAR